MTLDVSSVRDSFYFLETEINFNISSHSSQWVARYLCIKRRNFYGNIFNRIQLNSINSHLVIRFIAAIISQFHCKAREMRFNASSAPNCTSFKFH